MNNTKNNWKKTVNSGYIKLIKIPKKFKNQEADLRLGYYKQFVRGKGLKEHKRAS